MTELVTTTDAAALVQLRTLYARADALDAEIAALRTATATLDADVGALHAARHPALWLVLGRAGIDRPDALGAVTGREVVVVPRQRWWLLLTLVTVALLLGVAVGLLAGGLV